MKFSIKFSILSITLFLLISVSLAIIFIYQYTVDNILIETTKNSLSYESNRVDEHILRYLSPLDEISHIGAALIQNNSVIPKNSSKFIDFLYNAVTISDDIRTVYFADVNGNFYSIQQSDDDAHFSVISVINSINGIKKTEDSYYFSDKLKHTDSKKITNIPDQRSSYWYQKTINNKAQLWLTHFSQISSDARKNIEPVIASLYPIYSSTGELRGVFGANIPLSRVGEFIKNTGITPNTFVYICDNNHQVVLPYLKKPSLAEDFKKSPLSSFQDLKMPWVEKSYNLFFENKQPLFMFNFNNKEYVAVYKNISHTKIGIKVGIVTPVSDITAPLEISVLYALIALLFILILGIVLSNIFSTHLSEPIIKLAEDAELFCKFKIDEVKNSISHIKEISLIIDAFVKLKTALSSFKKYMPSALVRDLMLSGKIAEVGGENKKLTIMFADIENFTPVSEKMSPSDLMHYLSEYFEVATKTILKNGGTIDKYMGDGFLAFWGAPIGDPEHTLHCCKAALELQEAFKALNSSWRLKGNPEIMTRIGINTGEAIVGNVGSEDRLSYTVIGDAVNLASRMETLNKAYGTYTMVSEFVYNIAKDFLKFRLIDKVRVKGKTKGVCVYELLDDNTAATQEYINLLNDAFAKYENGDWQEALDLYLNLKDQYPDDKLIDVFTNRCAVLAKHSPSYWDGYWIMMEK